MPEYFMHQLSMIQVLLEISYQKLNDYGLDVIRNLTEPWTPPCCSFNARNGRRQMLIL